MGNPTSLAPTVAARATARASHGGGPEPGRRWARFRIHQPLGAGGMGTVYAAYEPELDRMVALKVPLPAMAGSGHAHEQLRREAQAMARVCHAGVVPIHTLGEFRGWTYYTMALVRGVSFRAHFATPRPWAEIRRAFLDVARALAAIHAAGVVHRDVKPSNLLYGDDGRVRITDFGIASPVVTDESSSGTPAYMAPEQLRGAFGDDRTDQFSFGVTLFEALHRVSPFDGVHPEERLRAIAAGPRPAPSRVPGTLDGIARRALSAARSDRFPDMHAVVAELAAAA